MLRKIEFKRLGASLAVLTLSTLLIGCGDSGLSRSKAKNMIIEKEGYPIPVTKILPVGQNVSSGELWPKELEALVANGVIEYTHHDDLSRGWTHIVSVSLTEKGRPFAQEYRRRQMLARCCEKEFVGIVGISEIELPMRLAEVRYEWKYANPTPFAPMYDVCREQIGKVWESKAIFRLC